MSEEGVLDRDLEILAKNKVVSKEDLDVLTLEKLIRQQDAEDAERIKKPSLQKLRLKRVKI